MHNHTQKQVKEANCQLGKRAGLHPQIRAVQHKGATKLYKKMWYDLKCQFGRQKEMFSW